MDTQPRAPDDAFTRDLAELDRQLEARTAPEIPTKTLDLIGGLLAGMTYIGRPAR